MNSDRVTLALSVACAALFVFVTGCENVPGDSEDGDRIVVSGVRLSEDLRTPPEPIDVVPQAEDAAGGDAVEEADRIRVSGTRLSEDLRTPPEPIDVVPQAEDAAGGDAVEERDRIPVSGARRSENPPGPPPPPITPVVEDENGPQTNVGRLMETEAEADFGFVVPHDPDEEILRVPALDGAPFALQPATSPPPITPAVEDENEPGARRDVGRGQAEDGGPMVIEGAREALENTPDTPVELELQDGNLESEPDAGALKYGAPLGYATPQLSGYVGWRRTDVGSLFVAGVRHDIATDTDAFVDPSESDQTLTGVGVSYAAPFKHARRYTPNWASDYVLRSGFSIDASYFSGDDDQAGAFRAAPGTGFAQPFPEVDEVWNTGYGTNGATAAYIRSQSMKQWDLGVRLYYDIDLNKALNPLRADRERFTIGLSYQDTDIDAIQRVEGTFFDLEPGLDPSYRSTTDLRLNEDRFALTLKKDLGYDVRAFGRDADLSIGAGVDVGYADTEVKIGFDLTADAPLGPSEFPVRQNLVLSKGRFFGEPYVSGGLGVLVTPRLRIELDAEVRAKEFATPERRLTDEDAFYRLDSETNAETRVTLRMTYRM